MSRKGKLSQGFVHDFARAAVGRCGGRVLREGHSSGQEGDPTACTVLDMVAFDSDFLSHHHHLSLFYGF